MKLKCYISLPFSVNPCFVDGVSWMEGNQHMSILSFFNTMYICSNTEHAIISLGAWDSARSRKAEGGHQTAGIMVKWSAVIITLEDH